MKLCHPLPRLRVLAVALGMVGGAACGGGTTGRDEFGDPGPPSLARPGAMVMNPAAGADAASAGNVDASPPTVDVPAAGGRDGIAGQPGGSGSSGGRGGGGGSGAGGGSGSGGRSDAGTVDVESPPDVCGSASAPGANCDQSLLGNPAFDRDETGWTNEIFATQALAAKDCANNPASGSLLITNTNFAAGHDGMTMAGTQQCVPVTPNTNYELSAQYHLAPAGGGVALGLRFFDGALCSGASITFVSGTSEVKDAWTWLRSPVIAAGESKSVMVRLLVQKPYKQPTLAASFDNVLLRKR